ncbi:MAG: hypothetical protein OHK0012_07540 [Synechococcales cyanobacterium]
MLLALEQEILTQLSPLQTEDNIRLLGLPSGSISGLPQMAGELAIGYLQTTFVEPERLGLYAQTLREEFVIALALRDLRSHRQAYPLLQKIRLLLLGYRPIAYRPVYLLAQKFIGLQENIWSFETRIAVPSTITPDGLVNGTGLGADLPQVQELSFWGGLE